MEKTLEQDIMSPEKSRSYLRRVIKNSTDERGRIGGFRTDITKKFKSGKINEKEKEIRNKILDIQKDTLNEYMGYHKNKLKTMKGSGIRRKQRGGNVMFFNNLKELLKNIGIDYW